MRLHLNRKRMLGLALGSRRARGEEGQAVHSEVAKEKAGHKRRINWRHRLRRGTKRRRKIVARRMRKWRAKRKCAAGLTAVSTREKVGRGRGRYGGM